MENLQKLYEGKAKTLYKAPNEDQIIIHFKDDTTAFNGEKKEKFHDKGIVNLAISNMILSFLEKMGIPTHTISQIDERTILAKKVKIFPIEFVVRNIATGSLLKITPFREGETLKRPLLEYFYKDDDLGDPLITKDHIDLLELCTKDQLETMNEYTLKINELLSTFFKKTGLILVDFKVEFGLTQDGNIVLGDEISPDSCRLWDKDTMEKFDKDVFRKDLGDMMQRYKEVLKRLEENNND
ncbi:MAG: phosphoribosylaminoimidazolesuccinocarboxamide synthase [Candidatus Muiribacterium halophilum]|uniref:Phosphoribosylaminoimidazole-succinocarboxamide synthase n=1 Tax=Muiribacterium halophilum TaxID=2053465 RepID=A0A2N5ZG46_MUIH1|nr:MAG: phosphoribosylaminoimidazolesuccinocarboxamide synthase [Candidatus Muirbacterium halophilum]